MKEQDEKGKVNLMNWMNYFGKGKKASLQDIIFLVIITMVFSILIVIMFKFLSGVNDQIQVTDEIPAAGKAGVTTIKETYRNTMDYLFFFIWLSAFLGAVITAWFIDTHPVFFILSIIALVVIFIALIPIINVNESILSSAELVVFTAEFPIILFFATHFFKIMIIQSFIVFMSLFAKSKVT